MLSLTFRERDDVALCMSAGVRSGERCSRERLLGPGSRSAMICHRITAIVVVRCLAGMTTLLLAGRSVEGRGIALPDWGIR